MRGLPILQRDGTQRHPLEPPLRAVVATAPGGPEALQPVEIDAPAAGPGEVELQVFAFGLNKAESSYRQGHSGAFYPDQALGIEAVGDGIRDRSGRFAQGERVATVTGRMMCARHGGHAERIAVKASHVVATLTLRRYEAGLNAADVNTIQAQYADDAVFMAQHRTPAVGRGAIETAYREILGTICLQIGFGIDEVVVVTPTVAYARTRSAGTTTIHANGAQTAEGNQELFVLVREHATGEWRIGRYIFSTTQPRG